MPAKGKQPLDQEALADLVRQLRRRASILQALSAVMAERELPEISVMNKPMVDRGLDSIDRFILSCKRELGEI